MPLSGKRPPTSTQLASLDPSAKPAYLRVKIWRHVALKRFRSGGSGPQIFKYAAGDSRRTCLNTSRPCCCQSSARSSRKRVLNARRVASGEPPASHPELKARAGSQPLTPAYSRFAARLDFSPRILPKRTPA
jgi:hypothetical protein